MTVDKLTERVARAIQESWSTNNGFCGEEVCPADRGFPCTCAMESTTAALTAVGIPLSVLAALADVDVALVDGNWQVVPKEPEP